MEALLSQSNIYEAAACDLIVDIFVFFNDSFDAINTSSDNPITITPTNTKIRPTPIESPPTNTKSRPTTTTNKTHTPPKDQQAPVIWNNNTNKKKKKKKQKHATPPENKHNPRDKTTKCYCGRGQSISTTRTEQP